MRLRGVLAAELAVGLLLTACATAPPPGPVRHAPPPRHAPEQPAAPVTRPAPIARLQMAALPGWTDEDHQAAFAAYRQMCASSRRMAASHPCADALDDPVLGESGARIFFETHFQAEELGGNGLLTAYFAPIYDARAQRDDEFSAPVRPPPANPAAAPDRAGIETEPETDALAWMRPEDLFFLQVQGSGTLVYPDGSRQRATFAASNGRDFVPIARPLLAAHTITATDAATLHAWLAAHRGLEADAAMALNPRYVFFRLSPDDGTEPKGAAGVALVPGRSVAVDPAAHPWFEALWIDAGAPTLAGARASYRRLVFALDTGGAIKGPIRADLYLGRGPAAGLEAGRVRHTLRLYRIVPADGADR